MQINIKDKKGIKLLTAEKYVAEDIELTLDESLFDQDYTIEDGLITRTLTHYTNNRVKEIGIRVLSHFITLESCEFNNVETIRSYAFYYCLNLKELNFPKATTIEANAFSDCRVATVARFDSLVNIKSEIIRSLTAMRIVYIPLVESIAGAPFADCTGLEAVIITQTNTVASLAATNAFVRSGIANGTGYIYVPDSLVEQYKSATNWSTFASQIKGLSELPQEIKEEVGIWI